MFAVNLHKGTNMLLRITSYHLFYVVLVHTTCPQEEQIWKHEHHREKLKVHLRVIIFCHESTTQEVPATTKLQYCLILLKFQMAKTQSLLLEKKTNLKTKLEAKNFEIQVTGQNILPQMYIKGHSCKSQVHIIPILCVLNYPLDGPNTNCSH